MPNILVSEPRLILFRSKVRSHQPTVETQVKRDPRQPLLCLFSPINPSASLKIPSFARFHSFRGIYQVFGSASVPLRHQFHFRPGSWTQATEKTVMQDVSASSGLNVVLFFPPVTEINSTHTDASQIADHEIKTQENPQTTASAQSELSEIEINTFQMYLKICSI